MPRIAMTHSLSNYVKCPISQYKKDLRHATPNTTMHFEYTYKGKDYNYHVKLDRTPCTYGGYRYWYICPHCGRRTSVLYQAGLYVCRHCIGANYQTQLNQPLDNVRRKKNKLGKKLYWWSGEIGNGYPRKPKGMHQQTFTRLWKEFIAIEEQETKYLVANFMTFAKRHNLDISATYGESD